MFSFAPISCRSNKSVTSCFSKSWIWRGIKPPAMTYIGKIQLEWSKNRSRSLMMLAWSKCDPVTETESLPLGRTRTRPLYRPIFKLLENYKSNHFHGIVHVFLLFLPPEKTKTKTKKTKKKKKTTSPSPKKKKKKKNPSTLTFFRHLCDCKICYKIVRLACFLLIKPFVFPPVATLGLPVKGIHQALGSIACQACLTGHVDDGSQPTASGSVTGEDPGPNRTALLNDLTLKVEESNSAALSLLSQVRLHRPNQHRM